MIILNIEEKLLEEEQLAIINYRGPPEDMANLINELSAWAEDHEIDVTGPPFAIYYSTPKKEQKILPMMLDYPCKVKLKVVEK